MERKFIWYDELLSLKKMCVLSLKISLFKQEWGTDSRVHYQGIDLRIYNPRFRIQILD